MKGGWGIYRGGIELSSPEPILALLKIGHPDITYFLKVYNVNYRARSMKYPCPE